jgi:hypothetical protein
MAQAVEHLPSLEFKPQYQKKKKKKSLQWLHIFVPAKVFIEGLETHRS